MSDDVHMSDTEYAPPLDKLLTLGEFYLRTSLDWVDYLALGIGQEHIPDLLRMVNDEELNDLESESPEVFAPIHAVRALGQLRDESTIQPLLQILTNHQDDDWLADEWLEEDIPRVFGLIGPAAIPALSDYLADSSRNVFVRNYAANALTVIAERYPEHGSSCVEGLTRTLERFEENEDELNATIINDLTELRAADTFPLIKKAYEAGRVGNSFMNLSFLATLMGLKEPVYEPSDFGIFPPGSENARIVDSLPVQPSNPPRNFGTVKFSRNKKKKKKKRR